MMSLLKQCCSCFTMIDTIDRPNLTLSMIQYFMSYPNHGTYSKHVPLNIMARCLWQGTPWLSTCSM
jgi:hypothetical protein